MWTIKKFYYIIESQPADILFNGGAYTMSFGKIIKKLRREREMTQEQLAETLSISPQAVSRWENDMAMPDISLIAPLCNLFNVTSDELLEIDLLQKQKHIKAICDEADKYSHRGYSNEARTILENGLKKYPDNIDLIYQLMFLSFWQRNDTGNSKYIDEAIKWGEQILERSTEDHQRHGAIQILCYVYRAAERIDDAVKLAKSMPLLCESQECLFSRIYAGNRAYEAKQNEIHSLFQQLSNSLFSLQTKLDSGEWSYTQDEYALLLDKRIALLNLFFEKGDFGFYHTQLCDTHYAQACYYAKKDDGENALKHLQSAAKHAIQFITSMNEECVSLVFRGMERGIFVTGNSNNDATRLLIKMKKSVFDKIRQTEEFLKIKESLLEYADKWKVE